MLTAQDLRVTFGTAQALRGASLDIRPGARIGIVGESGSGKSILAQCLMGMAPEGAGVTGRITVDGADMSQATEAQWRALRARRIAMIFQEPMAALNPLRRVGETVMEPLCALRGLSRAEARAHALALFAEVGLPQPETRLRLYPHELSGGQRQRVMIALALACDPAILIADEPTTALDAEVALRVTDLLVQLSRSRGMALVLISHDLSVVARATEDILVMYGGDIVERGRTAAVLRDPAHPYTRGLLAARPGPGGAMRHPGAPRPRLPTIPGTIPALADLPAGCRFAGRCPVELPRCAGTRPAPEPTRTGLVGCHHLAGPGGDAPHPAAPAPAVAERALRIVPRPTVQAMGLRRVYRQPRSTLLGARPRLTAVSRADLLILPGETLGIVGESGSGKSTLARMIMGFEPPDEGRVLFDGQDIHQLDRRALRALRPRFQMVFQDPHGSLDPRRTVGWSIAEPLRVAGRAEAPDRARQVAAALDQVGLRPADAARYPHEFSGGQRQRIAIARAIITRPELIVADEAVSALDMSVQAQILNLLMDLQDELGLAMLFISHDLAVVGAICDRIMVMKDGRVVETGPTARILGKPAEPYTRTLLAAADMAGPAATPPARERTLA
ncbi:dipeptide ABC transporter ATP-binding protein [Marinibacterium sp. SX1]|uniref:dipeptide ABC transporter ATP-binding protein n=1 Tax=Marinibacterium sp. SX1 TaxID=3388424 RepID=UPI003D167C47